MTDNAVIDETDESFLFAKARFDKDPLVPALIRTTGRGPLHVTSPTQFLQIIEDGEIRPNKGDLPFTFPQTERSYAFETGSVALFDFESATEVQIIHNYDSWRNFFYLKPFTVAMLIDRDRLAPKLIPNEFVWTLDCPYSRMWIPFVEAWYPDPIPLDWVKGFWVTAGYSNDLEVIVEEVARDDFPELLDLCRARSGAE